MAKQTKKSFVNLADAMKKVDDWRNGKNCKFTTGEVVERNNSELRSSSIPTRRY